MCGIFGTTFQYEGKIIQRKLEVFKFRGPDNTGIKVFNAPFCTLTLGHNRLSIIDLDIRANQPFIYNDDISIVFNGEIYNYIELKKQYLKDVKFITTSDTEVLCAMYVKFGKECVHLLNGAFAFVIYDKKNQKLFGCRDRLGKKPFYYYHTDKGFEFASQLFPICIGNTFTISELSRTYYFATQYIPDPFSIFNEVKKIPAGNYFEYSLENHTLNINKYWDIYSNSCGYKAPKTYEEALEVVDNLMYDAVNKRLIADVKVGTFLSGGIDSSLITAYASKIQPNIQAFSVGFNESDFDESFYSKSVSEYLSVDYNHVICTSKDAIDVLYNLQYYYDEPMGDFSAIPTSLIAQVAKKGVTVVLSGDGGDEMFFGYERYLRYASYQSIYKFPKIIRFPFSFLFDILGKRRLALSLRLNNVKELYMNRRKFFEGELFDALKVQQSMSEYAYLTNNNNLLKAFTDFDIKTLMNYAYNTKIDRASMRSSLELRTPFMDYRIVEYSRLLPIEYVYTKEIGQKRILRDLLYRDIPRKLFERKKMGFSLPLGDWFRGDLKAMVLDLINEDSLKLIPEYNAKIMIQARDNHLNGKENHTALLWLVLNYLMWYNIYKKLL